MIRRKSNRKMTLEARIARLERALGRKCESDFEDELLTPEEIAAAAEEWFDDNLTGVTDDEDDYWVQEAGSARNFYKAIAKRAADPIVDNCCQDIGVDEVSDDRDIVEKVLAKKAKMELRFL